MDLSLENSNPIWYTDHLPLEDHFGCRTGKNLAGVVFKNDCIHTVYHGVLFSLRIGKDRSCHLSHHEWTWKTLILTEKRHTEEGKFCMI